MKSNRLNIVVPLVALLGGGIVTMVACGSDDDDNETHADAGSSIDGGTMPGIPAGPDGSIGTSVGDYGDGSVGTSTGGDGSTGGQTGSDGGPSGDDSGPGGDDDGGVDGGADAGADAGDAGDAGTAPSLTLTVLRLGDGTTGGAPATASINASFLDNVASIGGAITPWATFSGFGVGASNSEGGLTRSTDRHSLALGGFAGTVGTAYANATTRAIASVSLGTNNAAAVQLTPVDATSAVYGSSTGAVIRGVATVDASAFWVSGTASGAMVAGAPVSAGVWYFPGGTAAQVGTQIFGAATTDPNTTRAIGFVGTLLCTSTTSETPGVVSAGAAPTTTATPALLLADSSSPYGFIGLDVNNDGTADVAYVADSSTGVIPYTPKTGGGWTAGTAVKIGGKGAFAITGVVNGDRVDLYAVTAPSTTAQSGIYHLQDSIATPALAADTTALATAPTNETFRGIALAPSAT